MELRLMRDIGNPAAKGAATVLSEGLKLEDEQ